MPQAPLGCQIDITKPTSTCSSVAGSVGGGGHGRGSGHWRVDNARWPTWSPPPARKARQAAGLGGRARWRPLSRGTEAGRPAEPGWCSPSGRPWLARGLTTGTLCRSRRPVLLHSSPAVEPPPPAGATVQPLADLGALLHLAGAGLDPAAGQGSGGLARSGATGTRRRSQTAEPGGRSRLVDPRCRPGRPVFPEWPLPAMSCRRRLEFSTPQPAGHRSQP